MAHTENLKQWGQSNEGLPGKFVDNSLAPMRTTAYGENIVKPLDRAQLAREGSYYIITNPTPNTGVAGLAAADGYLATQALMTIRNAQTAGDAAKRLVLDYIKLQVTVVGTNGTNVTYATHKDRGNTRWASAGTAFTPANLDLSSDLVSLAGVHFGALVLDAATADVQKLGSGFLRDDIMVLGDEFTFDFSGDSRPGAGGAALEGAVMTKQVIRHAPVVLNPEEEFIMVINAASQSVATSYEFEAGFYIR